MTSLADLPLRDDLRGQTPYGAPQLDVAVRLNANENSYPLSAALVGALEESLHAQLRDLNRYPDREFTVLRQKLARYVARVLSAQGDGTLEAVDPSWIWAANGSNEVLSHILQAFGGPGRTALGFAPSYSMHPLITTGTGARWVQESRNPDFNLDVDTAVAGVRRHQPDVTFLCTPNNPTGGAIPLDVIEAVLENTSGIVIVDEAYAEFARPGYRTAIDLVPAHPRLVVSRTMSKAFAFAGARVGYAIAQPAFIDALRLVRLPYHLSALTQAAAGAALDHTDELLSNVDRLIVNRDRMSQALRDLGFSVVPSDSNFLLFGRVADPEDLFDELLARDVLIRNIGIAHHVRVNAGTDEETDAFITAVTAAVAAKPSLVMKETNV